VIPGAQGRGEVSRTTYYQLTTEKVEPTSPSDASTAPDSPWVTNVQTVSKTAPYLWSYTRIEYSDGTWERTQTELVSTYGVEFTNNLIDKTNQGTLNWSFVFSNSNGSFSYDWDTHSYTNGTDLIAVSADSNNWLMIPIADKKLTTCIAMFKIDTSCFVEGKEYTLSFKVSAPLSVGLTATIADTSGAAFSETSSTFHTESNNVVSYINFQFKAIKSGNVNSYGYITLIFAGMTSASTGFIYIGELKLESGYNALTYWTASANDNAGASYTRNILDDTNNGTTNWGFYLVNDNGEFKYESESGAWYNGTTRIKPTDDVTVSSSGYYGIKLPVGGQSLTACSASFPVRQNRIAKGYQYTLSVKLQLALDSKVSAYIANANSSTRLTDTVVIEHKAGYSYLTFHLTGIANGSDSSGEFFVWLSFSNILNLGSGESIYLGDLKLEEGYNSNVSWSQSNSDNQGVQGCIQRVTEWGAGFTYHNDKSLTTFPRYIDIVTINVNGKQKAFQCKLTHNSDSSNSPLVEITGTATSSTHWTALSSLNPIYTPLLLADNAVIQFMQGNQLLIMDSNNLVAAGMVGGNIPIWAGSSNPDTAPFRVGIDGQLIAENAKLEGSLTAGTANKDRIEIDPTSKSISFFNEDGAEMSVFSSGNMSTPEELFDEDGDATVINLTLQNTTGMQESYNESGTNDEQVLESVFISDYTFTKQSNLALHGSIDWALRVWGETTNEVRVEMDIFVRVKVYSSTNPSEEIFNKAIYEGHSLSAEEYKTLTGTFSLDGFQVSVPAGLLKIVASTYIYSTGETYGYVRYGTKGGATSAISAELAVNSYKSRYYGNGLCLGRAKNNFVALWKDSNEDMCFEALNPFFGFKVTTDGVAYKKGTGDWNYIAK
jgi:hypothetical protein